MKETIITQSANERPGEAQGSRPRLRVRQSEAPVFTKTSSVIFALVILLYAGLRLWRLTEYGLFSDEAFTAETVSLAWREMMSAIIRDAAHPPLFYLLLKTWSLIGGGSLLWMKLFPAALSIASIIPFRLLCRELRLKPAAMNLALWLMAVNEYLINYAQELRMYSLLFFLTIASFWAFAKLVNFEGAGNRLWLAMFAANLLLIYAHYYGWLIIGVELLFLLISRRDLLLRFSLLSASLAVAFMPWAFLVAQAAIDKGGLGPNLNWNAPPKAVDFTWFYAILNGPVYIRWKAVATVCAAAFFLAPVLRWAFQPETESKPTLIFLSLGSFVPAVVAFAASRALPQSIWGTRYLIVVAPAYLLLLSVAAMRLRPARLKFIAVALMIAWAAFSGGLQLANRDKIAWEPLVQKMIQAEADRSTFTKVYATQGVVATTVQYYLDSANEKRLRIEYADDYARLQGERFWVAFLKYAHDNNPLPQTVLMERGYKVGDIIEAAAPGHKVFLFPVWRD